MLCLVCDYPMKITFVASACILIEYTDGYRVLCDPWLTDGQIYYGEWRHNPELRRNWIQYFNDNPPDSIYISHIHEDHLDPFTLKQFTFKDVPVFTGPFEKGLKPIQKIVQECGFDLYECFLGSKHEDRFQIWKADGLELDSFVWFEDPAGIRILNMNDCVYEDVKKQLNEFPRDFDLTCLPYSGASPFPQCFDSMTKWEKEGARNESIQKYLMWLGDYCRQLKPKAILPFAGQYKLREESLNKYLAMPFMNEVISHIPASIDIVLPREGREYYVGTDKLLDKARDRLVQHYPNSGETTLIIQTEARRKIVLVRDAKNVLTIKLSEKLLWEALTKRKHWNNLELAGLLRFDREGAYDKALHYCLSFFHI